MAALETSRAAEYHATPNGTDTGVGTRLSPLSLAKALSATSPAKPGDTIWLHGGTYQGAFTSYLKGTSIKPIIVRQYPGERAILNCTNQGSTGLDVEGSGTWYWGFEIENTDTNRVPVRGGGLSVNPSFAGANNKFINLAIHDTGNAVFLSWIGTNSEVTGCLIYNNGWQGAEPDRGHGHGIYGQSKTDQKLLRDNIIFNQFGLGIQLYTAAIEINHFNIDRNILFNNGSISSESLHQNILVGGHSVEDITVSRNILYMSAALSGLNMQLVWGTSTNGSAVVQSNYFVGVGPEMMNWTNIVFTENTIAGFGRLTGFRPIEFKNIYDWNRNHYYAPGGYCVWNSITSDAPSWSQWQDSGYDANGTLTNANPTGVQVLFHPNPYESGRANISVLNWDLLDRVNVDLTGLLRPGTPYEIRNAQDYFGTPVATGTYTGQLISLPTTNLPVAKPVGVSSPPAATGPQFNVFVLLAVQRISPPKNPMVAPAK